MEAFHSFYVIEDFEKSLNASFIALITKSIGAMDLKDFRPISLVGGAYKLIAKELSIRFKKVIDKVISESQHAFVGDCQIVDAVLIANEIVDARVQSGDPGLLCK